MTFKSDYTPLLTESLRSDEFIKALCALPRERRFSGNTLKEFQSWSREFNLWLNKLANQPIDMVTCPGKVEITSECEWHGGRRIELSWINPMYNLKVPATILEPDPTIRNGAGLVCQHGHGWFGRRPMIGEQSSPEMIKELEQYNYAFALSMMKSGYTVIAIDLFNFGERELIERPAGRDKCDMVEVFLQLFNINLMALKISEIRQAITVLGQNESVNAERIGMVGLSQGGRMTMFTTALDPRIKVAVVSGSCNTFIDRLTLRSGACGAQILPGLMPDADTADVFASIAPRPLMLQWGDSDPLIVEKYSTPELEITKKAFKAASCPEHLNIHKFAGGHVVDHAAAAQWFDTHL
jgi:dienelactone hydrolase